MRRLMFNLKLKLRAFICKVKAGMIHALGGVTKLESAQTVMNDRYTRRDIQIKTARYTRMIEFRDTSPDYFKCYVESFKICSCAYWSNDGYAVYTGPDDFCSKGEPKIVDEEQIEVIEF